MTQLFREGTKCAFAEYLSRSSVSDVQENENAIALQARCKVITIGFGDPFALPIVWLIAGLRSG